MDTFKAVAVPRLYRMIADQIAEKIRAGNFAPRARLPSERELAEQLQVSRASIREALIALELEGYVDVRVGAGVFVSTTPTPVVKLRPPLHTEPLTDIGPFDLLETRLLLEPECAALAAQMALPEEITAIEQAHAAMSQGGVASEHDHAFHMAIASACGNAALASAIAHIWQLSMRSPIFSRLDKHFVTRKVWQKAEIEHGRILAAIVGRDPLGARHAMHDHLVGILDRLRQDFGKGEIP